MPSYWRQALKVAGYDLVKFSKSDRYEALLGSILDGGSIDLLIDCGANEGQFADRCRQLGYRGQIISFEPSAEPFGKLKNRAANDGRWTCFNLALGEAAEKKPINLSIGLGDFNSFLAAKAEMLGLSGSMTFFSRPCRT